VDGCDPPRVISISDSIGGESATVRLGRIAETARAEPTPIRNSRRGTLM
jgi:hypothetical protein